MSFRTLLRATALLGLLGLALPGSHAQVVTFTDRSSFNAAVASGYNPLQVTNFDSVSPGVIANGGTVEGTTFNYSLGTDSLGSPVLLQIGSTFPTTSPHNYLGTTADDSLLSGDQFTMTFAQPLQAIGLYILSGGVNLAGDYSLTVSQGTANSSGTVDPAFSSWSSQGTNVYFLGLVESDTTKSFTSVTFSSVGGLGVPFNVDDIVRTSVKSTSTVPDNASTGLLVLLAFAGLLGFRRRRI